MRYKSIFLFKKVFSIVSCIFFTTGMCMAFEVIDKSGALDDLAFISPQLKVSEALTDAKASSVTIPNLNAIQTMLSELGPAWRVIMDLRTGKPSPIEGGAIPWIPGPANNLAWESIIPNCWENTCIPVEVMETMARKFWQGTRKYFF